MKLTYVVLPLMLAVAGCATTGPGVQTAMTPGAAAPSPAAPDPGNGAQPTPAIDWGSDTSDFAQDGECDDPRFMGPGMTDTPLVETDIRADATDCRAAYEAGRISLKNA
ncbi:hypothetical protein ACMA5I_08345 [Paracoccaceae bacterium GXU_MW_L88]